MPSEKQILDGRCLFLVASYLIERSIYRKIRLNITVKFIIDREMINEGESSSII
jgi:hypothetical protein